MGAKERWMITGGAGYIGAHIVDEFLGAGYDTIVYDSLNSGRRSRIEFLQERHQQQISLIEQDICNSAAFEEAIDIFKPDGIVHLAGLKSVSESVKNSDTYFEVNYTATSRILDVLTKKNISRFIFSSSAAVYGSPQHLNLVCEEDEKTPISPYGESKLAAESVVTKYLNQPGNRGTSLRYFNVIGTDSPMLIDESSENLVPIVVKNLLHGVPPMIYGTDYPTFDGTCIRDYIDVRDVARAHVYAAEFVNPLPPALNVGTGKGKSVREVIHQVSRVANLQNYSIIESERRIGDPANLCADVSLIEKTLNFKTKHSFESSIRSLFDDRKV